MPENALLWLILIVVVVALIRLPSATFGFQRRHQDSPYFFDDDGDNDWD